MRCHEFEKRFLRSLDERLSPEEKEILKTHMADCPSCRKRDKEYRMLLGFMRLDHVPEPLPNFWERLAPRLEERMLSLLPNLGFQQAMKTLSAALAVLVIAAGSLLFIAGRNPERTTQSEILLLQDENPFLETKTLLEEKKVENRGMMLIFASAEESFSSKKELP